MCAVGPPEKGPSPCAGPRASKEKEKNLLTAAGKGELLPPELISPFRASAPGGPPSGSRPRVTEFHVICPRAQGAPQKRFV